MDSQSAALSTIVELARLSRLTLLYHGAAASAADGAREQAAALAAVAAAPGEIVVLFDAGSDLPVPDLLADIEAAVLEAAPQAPLAPPMAGPVEALAFWQQALDMRFLLIMRRFDIALSRQDPEFDDVLRHLANDPLDASVLLLMDEAAAPLLQRLKDALPELGETFLRLPEPAAAATAGVAAASPSLEELVEPAALEEPAPGAAPAAPAARFGPSPFLFDDPDDELNTETLPAGGNVPEEVTVPAPPAAPSGQQDAPQESAERRRSRRFSTLLEQRVADGFDAPAEPVSAPGHPEDAAPAPAADAVPAAAPSGPVSDAPTLRIYPTAVPLLPAMPEREIALPDGRAEPSFELPPARFADYATSSPAARVYRERRPMQVAAWMHKRRSRRRRDVIGVASRVGNSSAVLVVLMTLLAVLGWQMPQLRTSAGASPPRAAIAQPSPQSPQALALRGNNDRRSLGSATSSGTRHVSR